MSGKYILVGSVLENVGKSAVSPGVHGQIGKIPHGQIWLDWGHILVGSVLENVGKSAVSPGVHGQIGKIPHGQIWLDWGL